MTWTGADYVALADDGFGVPDRWRSTDGLAWTLDPSGDPSRAASPITEVTLDEGTVLEVRRDSVVETAPDGEVTVYRAAEVFEQECASIAPCQAIATDGSTAVVAMGGVGVAHRTADGEWSQHAVGDFEPGEVAYSQTAGIAGRLSLPLTIAAFVLGIVLLASSRLERKAAPVVIFVALGGLLLSLQLFALLAIDLDPDPGQRGDRLWVLTAACIVVWAGLLIGVAAIRRRARARWLTTGLLPPR